MDIMHDDYHSCNECSRLNAKNKRLEAEINCLEHPDDYPEYPNEAYWLTKTKCESLHQNSKGQAETFNALMKMYRELEAKCDKYEEALLLVQQHYNTSHWLTNKHEGQSKRGMKRKVKQALANEHEER